MPFQLPQIVQYLVVLWPVKVLPLLKDQIFSADTKRTIQGCKMGLGF